MRTAVKERIHRQLQKMEVRGQLLERDMNLIPSLSRTNALKWMKKLDNSKLFKESYNVLAILRLLPRLRVQFVSHLIMKVFFMKVFFVENY